MEIEKERNSSCNNSFLQETENNSDIGSEIRREIDYKFFHSKVNLNYVFPRIKKIVGKTKPDLRNSKKLVNHKSQYFHNNTPLNYSSKKKLPSLTNTSAIQNPFNRTSSNQASLNHSISKPAIKKGHRRIISELSAVPIKYKKSPYLKNLSQGKSVKSNLILIPSFY